MKKLFSVFLALMLCLAASAALADGVPRSTSKLPAMPSFPDVPQIIRVQKAGSEVTLTLDRELPRESLVTAIGLDQDCLLVTVNAAPEGNLTHTAAALPQGVRWTAFEIAWVEGKVNALARYNEAGGLMHVTCFDNHLNEYVFDSTGTFYEYANSVTDIRARFDSQGTLTCYGYEARPNTTVWFDRYGDILWADYNDGILAATWEPDVTWFVSTPDGRIKISLNVKVWGCEPLFTDKPEEEEKPKRVHYPNNTICLAGLSLQETSSRLPDKWYNVVPIDLTRQGRQTYFLTISNSLFIGECYVDVWGDEVTVSYVLIKNSAIEPKESYGRWFTSLSQITERSIESKENGFVFGEPLSISEDLGGAETALLFIRSKASYYLPFSDGTELTKYWRNKPDWKEFRKTLQELVPLVAK